MRQITDCGSGSAGIVTPMAGRTHKTSHEAARGSADAADHLREQVHDMLEEAKPKLRGWLHAATAPLTLAAGIVLIALSPNAETRLGSSIFAATALVLFTVSAVYHRGTWSPRVWKFLKRFDHANIFLLIAGSYTPFTLLLLEGRDRTTLLTLVWLSAAAGILFRIFWVHAPRWLYTPIYISMGWAAVFYFGDFVAHGGAAVLTLLVVGGVLYTVGGVIYGLKRPNPFPGWFGFHEVFHTLTILAFITHYIGVSIATYSLR